MRPPAAGRYRAGLALGAAASLLIVGMVTAATAARTLEGPPDAVFWVLAGVFILGAVGVVTGRRLLAAVPVGAPLVMGSVEGAPELGVPAVGDVPVATLIVVSTLTVVAIWIAPSSGPPSLAGASILIVAGGAALVLTDPVVAAMLTAAPALVASLFVGREPLIAVAFVVATVGLWVGLVWLLGRDQGWPPVIAVTGLVTTVLLAGGMRATSRAATTAR